MGACGAAAVGGASATGEGREHASIAFDDVRCEASEAAAGGAHAAPATVRFTSTPIAPGPVGLTYASAAWSGREHLLFGGATPSTPEPPGTPSAGDYGVWVESPTGAPWTSIGWALDPALGTWRVLPGDAPPGSAGTDPVAWHCGRAFILTAGGAGYRYDPESGAMRATSTDGAPEHCSGRRIVTHGPLALVWGCDGCAAHVYDASADRWETLRPGDDVLPSAGTRCDWLPTAVVAGRFAVMRRYRDRAGALLDLGTRTWSPIAESGAPESVLAGPVGDASALSVTGQTGSVAGVYRLDLSTGTWSHTDLRDGVCNLGSVSSYVDGVLVSAGEHAALPMACAYDLARGAHAGEAARGASSASTVTSVGDGHVFFWSRVSGTGHGDGEMPRTPTHWIENAARVVTFEITR